MMENNKKIRVKLREKGGTGKGVATKLEKKKERLATPDSLEGRRDRKPM